MGKKKSLTHLTGSDIFKALKTWLLNVSNWQVLEHPQQVWQMCQMSNIWHICHTKHQKSLLSDVLNRIKFTTCEQYRCKFATVRTRMVKKKRVFYSFSLILFYFLSSLSFFFFFLSPPLHLCHSLFLFSSSSFFFFFLHKLHFRWTFLLLLCSTSQGVIVPRRLFF